MQVKCRWCKESFDTPSWKIRQGKGKYCSVKCRVDSTRTTEDKFLSRINKLGPIHSVLKTRCWLWVGYVASDGYGVIRTSKIGELVHRKSWEVFNGIIPLGMRVLHKCDVRHCVNPSHLFIGTDLDNIKDRDNKGRQTKGEKSHLAKLSNEDVVAIRKEYDAGGNQRSIASKFSISVSQVRWIGKRWVWKHLLEE